MARWGALPAVFGKVHPRYLTPTVSTIGMGALSIVWTLLARRCSTRPRTCSATRSPRSASRSPSTTASSGFASAWYFRHELRRSPGVFLRVGLLPLLGGLLMLGDLRQGPPRLQRARLRLRGADRRDPGSDRDRDRRAAPRAAADAPLRAQSSSRSSGGRPRSPRPTSSCEDRGRRSRRSRAPRSRPVAARRDFFDQVTLADLDPARAAGRRRRARRRPLRRRPGRRLERTRRSSRSCARPAPTPS